MTIYIGLSGTIAAGKGEVLRIIKEKSIKGKLTKGKLTKGKYTPIPSISYSLSDELRVILKEMKKEITRDNLMKIGNDLRKENGSNYLAMRLIEKVKRIENPPKIIMPGIIIFDSIRNPTEIIAFKNEFGNNFSLFFIDASKRIRYERVRKRKREGEGLLSFNEFTNKNEKDLGKNQPEWGTKLKECKKLADFIIINDKSFNDLENKVMEVLNLCLKETRKQG